MRLPSAAQLSPLRLPGFRNLFYATLASSVGTLVAAVALAIDVKDRTGSGLWVGAVLIVEFLPTIVVGLLLGPLLDRLERRSLMIAADALRVGVFAALPFAPNAATVVALALVAGLANGFFRPAVYAGVPNLVPAEELPRANALLQTVENLSWADRPGHRRHPDGGRGPEPPRTAINAVSFLVSIALVVRIPPRLLQSERALSRGHWRDLGDGFVAAFRSPSLRAVLVAWGIASLGVGARRSQRVFLAKNTFSSGDFGYGLIYGAIGVGLVVGSFVSASMLERFGVARAYGGSLLVMAIGYLSGAASPNVWVAAVCCRRPRPRERRGRDVQRAARAARHVRRATRARADLRDERDVRSPRDRHARRRAFPAQAGRAGRTALVVGGGRRGGGCRCVRRLGSWRATSAARRCPRPRPCRRNTRRSQPRTE